MSVRKTHRQLLLSTATLMGAPAGYARIAAFAATIIAGATLWAEPARAQDGTWLLNPGSNDFNTAANWNPAAVPTGTAFFGTSNTTSLTFSADTTIGGWTFNAGADNYQFTIISVDLEFNGAGIVINSGSATITNNSGLIFGNNSTAGSAAITSNGALIFNDNSTAGSATITSNSTLTFFNNSTAGNAAITNNDFLIFGNNSTAGNAAITNNSGLGFNDNSTGGQAQILTNAAGRTDFSNSTGPLNNNALTAGSLAGAGSYFLGPNQLTVGGNNLSTEVSGIISDCGPAGNNCLNPGATVTGGSLVKTGTGTFTLSGANTYTGPTTVNAGTLVVDGSIVSPTTVNNGATLMGTGVLGPTTVNSGGVYAPGNSIGTMVVNGAFRLARGAAYEVEVNAAGQNDKVIVRGTVNLTGATLRVLAANGNYKPRTNYTIIKNDGSDAVKGKFAKVTNNLAFLTPFVNYAGGDGNDVVLSLLRTVDSSSGVVKFIDLARTRNQRAVAGALDQFPTTDPLFLAVLAQSAAGARQAFDALSGEVHASVAGTVADDSRYVREAVLGRLMQANHAGEALAANGPQMATFDGQAYALGYDGKSLIDAPARARAPLAFWNRAFGAWGDFDSDGNAASADRDLGGFISGMDANIGGSWRVGLATGASFANVDVDHRYSSADVETYHLGGYLGGMAGPLALRGGGLWAWNDIDTSRAVVFPGFFERQSANYDADTGQLFGEIAYPTQMGGIALEPFGGIAFVSIDTGSFRERGGALASLRGVDVDQDVGYATLGLRAATTMMWGAMQVTPHVEAAWQHAFDDVIPGAALAFASTGIGFAIDGVPLAEDSALLDAGLDFALGERMTAGVSYTGQFSSNVTDNGVKGRFTFLFN